MAKRPRESTQQIRAFDVGAVKRPALALQVTGWLGLALSLLALGLSLYLMSVEGGRDNTNNRLLAFSILGICWGAVVLSGGWKMKQLRSRRYAVAAAMVALIPCNACWVLGAPSAIWALMVLSRPDIKSAFR